MVDNEKWMRSVSGLFRQKGPDGAQLLGVWVEVVHQDD